MARGAGEEHITKFLVPEMREQPGFQREKAACSNTKLERKLYHENICTDRQRKVLPKRLAHQCPQ
jgi:hypothetical protein